MAYRPNEFREVELYLCVCVYHIPQGYNLNGTSLYDLTHMNHPRKDICGRSDMILIIKKF